MLFDQRGFPDGQLPNVILGIVTKVYALSEEPTESPRYAALINGYNLAELNGEIDLGRQDEMPDIWRLEIFEDTNHYEQLKEVLFSSKTNLVYVGLAYNGDIQSGVFPIYNEFPLEYYQYAQINQISPLTPNVHSELFSLLATSVEEEWDNIKNKPLRNITKNLMNDIQTAVDQVYVEPVGQGNYTRLYDDKDRHLVSFDIGFGSPLRIRDYPRWSADLIPPVSTPTVNFITHWDLDHYKLAEVPNAFNIEECYWVFPFSLNNDNDLQYESNMAVLRLVSYLLTQGKSIPLKHSAAGTFPFNAFSIDWETGPAHESRNNAGAAYRLMVGDRYDPRYYLFPGDKCYSLLSPSWSSKCYSGIVPSHHGSENLATAQIPRARRSSSIAAFSFGLHTGYGHPRHAAVSDAHRQGYDLKHTLPSDWRAIPGIRNHNVKIDTWKNHKNRIRLL